MGSDPITSGSLTLLGFDGMGDGPSCGNGLGGREGAVSRGISRGRLQPETKIVSVRQVWVPRSKGTA